MKTTMASLLTVTSMVIGIVTCHAGQQVTEVVGERSVGMDGSISGTNDASVSTLIDGTPAASWIARGRAAEEAEEYPKARACYLEVAEACPTGSVLHAQMLCRIATIDILCRKFEVAEQKCAPLLQSRNGDIRAEAHFLMARLCRATEEYGMMRDHLRLAISSGFMNETVARFATETRHLGPEMIVPYDITFEKWGEKPVCRGVIDNQVMAFSGDMYLYRTNGIVCQEASTNAFSGHAVGYRPYLQYFGSNVIWEVDYVNGLEHGCCTWWYTNGVKLSEGLYTGGEPDGAFVSWWPEGATNCITRYNRGFKLGIEGRWRRDGIPIHSFKGSASLQGQKVTLGVAQDNTRLTNMVVSIGTDVISVPSNELKDATNPWLATLRVGESSNDPNGFYVSLTCGSSLSSPYSQPPKDLYFCFHDGKFAGVKSSPTPITKDKITEPPAGSDGKPAQHP